MERLSQHKLFQWLLACLILALASCSSGGADIADESQAGPLDTISIESPAKNNDKYLNQNQVFDSINYIPLETTKESLFSEINQLEVVDDLMIVLDWATNSILTFNKSGKFLSKIKSKNVREFAINGFEKLIVFQDISNAKTYHYSYDGKLIKSYDNPFIRSNLVFLDSNLVAYYKYFFKENKDSKFNNFNLFLADRSNNIQNGFLRFDTAAISYKEVYNSEKQFYKSSHSTYFIQPYDYRIYDITLGKPIAKYIINIPEANRLPHDFRTNGRYFESRFDYLTKYSNEVFQIKDFYVVNSIAVFKIGASKWNNTFVYDVNNKDKISIYNILSGPDNNFMPIGEEFYASDVNSFYRAVRAQELFKIKFNLADKIDDSRLPKGLKVFFDTQNNLSNPVIVQMFPGRNKRLIPGT